MNVFLISLTPNTEKQILFCARVSSDQSSDKVGLLSYLIKKEHWSPFEMAHAVFEINTSRAIAAQILRHRSFSFQEFSQRYASPTETVKYKARRQAETNRQSSIDDLDQETIDWFNRAQSDIAQTSFKYYEYALERGIAKECARFLLPVSTTSKLYMSGTIRSWIHYVNLRCQDDVQEEHRVLALEMRNILADKLPNIAKALKWTTQ